MFEINEVIRVKRTASAQESSILKKSWVIWNDARTLKPH